MAILMDSTIDEKCPKCRENLSRVNMGVNVGKKYCGYCGYNQLQLALGDMRGALLQLEAAIRRFIKELMVEAQKHLSKPCGLPREEALKPKSENERPLISLPAPGASQSTINDYKRLGLICVHCGRPYENHDFPCPGCRQDPRR